MAVENNNTNNFSKNQQDKYDQVDYSILDSAKNAFISASRKTLNFASDYGEVPGKSLGASANIFLPKIIGNSGLTLVTEGLGTADDARPEDLSDLEETEFWKNIAYKVMSCLSNDVASGGLQTVLVSLYLPSSNPELVFNKNFLHGFLDGFVSSCKQVGCVYISGETPQLKGKFVKGKLDIAGSAFGVSVLENNSDLNQTLLKGPQAGDRIVLIESSGPHENGFTPIRALAKKLDQGFRTKLSDGTEFYKAANQPSKLYTPFVREVLKKGCQVTGFENITGHGWQKIMRSSAPLRYVINKTLPVLPIFKFLQENMNASVKDMLTIFNYGAGFVAYVKPEDADRVISIAKELNLKSINAGYIEKSSQRQVFIEEYNLTLSDKDFLLKK